MRGFRPETPRIVAAIMGLVVIAGLLAPAALAQTTPSDCPEVYPIGDLRRGMVGTGLTVSQDRTIETFNVEVLGVLSNGIGPGRDMIIVDTSSPAIDAVKGIWFGMSGSPVYIDGKLVGAIAFGLTAAPSTIAGITPGQHMMDLISTPPETSPDPAASPGPSPAPSPVPASEGAYRSRVRLTDSLRATIARHEGMTEDEVGTSMSRLKLPLGVSGVGQRGLDHVMRSVAREGLPFVPYLAGSASPRHTGTHGPGVMEPGSSVAAALSYGDVTAAGVGTTTIVCNGRLAGFGHPFDFFPRGGTALGGNHADVITIVNESLGGPFKLANVAESFGTVDQDRFAGIRGIFGAGPRLIPIRSTISSLDTGVTRTGQTDAVLSEVVPFIAFIHVLTNVDFTHDQIGEGTANLTWKIAGTTASGTPWELNRSNLFASEGDISAESLFEFQSQLFQLFQNPYEDIEFSSVDITGTYDDELKQYEITGLQVRVGRGEFGEPRRVRARAGQVITLRVELAAQDGTEKSVDLRVRIPTNPRGDAFIEVSGGNAQFGGEGECFFEGGECFDPSGAEITTFEELIASLENRPKNNELLAKLFTRGIRPKSTDSETLDQVVSGFEFVRVRVIDSVCCAGAGSRPRR
ncbi:MAG TPA: SpoIVB peptidase S55 domain-containing protein [Actinomycetota bacterium]|nr:SpoIVB peptidase S55 domain-containing protein [Actinomycetota bacterium]